MYLYEQNLGITKNILLVSDRIFIFMVFFYGFIFILCPTLCLSFLLVAFLVQVRVCPYTAVSISCFLTGLLELLSLRSVCLHSWYCKQSFVTVNCTKFSQISHV